MIIGKIHKVKNKLIGADLYLCGLPGLKSPVPKYVGSKSVVDQLLFRVELGECRKTVRISGVDVCHIRVV